MATKSDVIEKVVKKNSFLDKEIVISIVDSFFMILSDALKDHNRIEIRGFASFSVRSYSLKKEVGSTLHKFKKSQYNKVYFRSSESLSNLINE